MNGQIEEAQERLEVAAYKWRKAKNRDDRNTVDGYKSLGAAESELESAINHLETVTNDYLREKGSI